MTTSAAHEEPIAVVGMAARLPGISDLDGYWRLMMDRRNTIGPVPASRWAAEEQPEDDPEVQAVGGFFEAVDQFDPTFFAISPREAADMDPQQRFMLEVSWRALENAGQPVAALRGSNTGVYVGGGWNDYQGLRKELRAAPTPHSIVGSQLDGLSARVSFAFRLTGPSIVVSTGCSGSLVALHLAVQALRVGEIDGAIVGGVNLILLPDSSIGLTHLGVLSPAGSCKAFGAGADGYVRGEGALAVYLKRLSRAVSDGDRVHAVVVSTAVNQDGGGDSFTTPHSAGQEELLRRVYDGSGIRPDRLRYVEAHGTGTERGDPIEAGALARVLGARRGDAGGPLGIGSVKTNVGHLEAAAGLAGFVKVVLSLMHGVVPPSLNAEDLNPEIPFEHGSLEVTREPLHLPSDDDVLLAVNSFGWGGTNAHAVLGPAHRVAAPASPAPRGGEVAPAGPTLVPLSGHHPEALTERAADLRAFLSERDDDRPTLADVAGTLAWRRDHHSYRAAFLADDIEQLAEQLAAFRSGAEQPRGGRPAGPARACRRVAFVFPGQGSQWAAMGCRLHAESPTFASTIDRCAEALAPHLAGDLTEIVTGAAGDGWLSRLDLVQPVLWAVSLGLAELWREAGVEPDVVVGHSQGEITAATCAGILSYDDAAMLVARRSAIVQRTAGRGRMLAVDLELEQARAALAGFEDSVALAAHNGPRSCVLSGDTEAILVLQQLLEADGTFCRLVNVDYASHSPQMDALREDLAQAANEVRPRAGAVPLMSTVRVAEVSGPELDAGYWVDNLCRPVLLSDALQRLFETDVTHVVEISPHPVLAPAIEQLVAGRQDSPVVLTTLRRDAGSPRELQRAFADAYEAGLEPFGRLSGTARVPLPPYPWQPSSCWIEARRVRRSSNGGLRFELEPAVAERDAWHGSIEVELDEQPWLADHRVGEAVVLPATASLGMCLGVATARLGGAPRTLTEVAFRTHLALGNEPARLAAIWRDDLPGEGVFALSSLPPGADAWSEHVIARALREPAASSKESRFPTHLLACDAIASDDFYATCEERGLAYGPTFRGVERIHTDGREALGAVSSRRRAPRTRPGGLDAALWDGALQVALTLCEPGATVVPVGIDRLHVLSVPEEPVAELWSHAVRLDEDVMDVVLFDAGRRPLMAIEGLRLQRLVEGGAAGIDRSRVHRLRFRPEDPVEPGTGSARWAVCGALDGDDAVAQLLAAFGEGCGRGLPAVGRDRGWANALRSLDEPCGVAFIAPAAGAGLAKQERGLLALAEVVLACLELPTLPRIAVVTRGAQAVVGDDRPDPGAALYWGFCRVLAREHPELRAVAVDTDAGTPDWAAVSRELLGDDDADQVALRGERRLVGAVLRGGDGEETTERPPWQTPPQPFRMRTKHPGLWEGLEYCAAERPRPRAGEVEVEVSAASLNFIDVMKALGTYPDASADGSLFGGECAGRIVAVGPYTNDVAVGDRVVACAFGSLGSHVTAPVGQVRPIPDGLEDDAAAALPLVYTTAWYALHDLARLSRGETVLVHSAAGGLGLAAIAVSRHLGATVLATAGTPDKREHLRRLGIEHVFDSRDRSWAAGVRAATEGRGVDVVLNSLAGAAIPLGLELLADLGRFVEVGKRDIHDGRSITLAAFRKGITLAAVDLAGLMRERPRRFADLLARVWELVAAGELAPLPVTTHAFADGRQALQEMSRGRHVGKLVLRDPATVADVAPEPMPGGRFRRDATYLLTGGLGALGLSLAEFMSERGAGTLALLARSAPSEAALGRIERMRARGTEVVTFQADLTDAEAVGDVLSRIRAQLPRLRGVLHLAGTLDDATILNLQPSQLGHVIGPKLHGALHLDELTDADPLDLFVVFSSAATLIGSPGQSVYAAANAALDALAQRRRLRGRPGLSVQWGPFEEVGLAAQDGNRGSRLAARGLDGFATDEAWEALAELMHGDDTVVAYMPLNLRQWFDAYPQAAAQRSWARLAALASDGDETADSGSELLELLRRSGEDERLGLVEARVRELAGAVLRLDVEAVAPDLPFKALGLDSLMGLELRNRLESSFALRLSPTLLWTHGSARALSVALCELLSADADAALDGTRPAERVR